LPCFGHPHQTHELGARIDQPVGFEGRRDLVDGGDSVAGAHVARLLLVVLEILLNER